MDQTNTSYTEISIQVSLSGFSFNGSPWYSPQHVFTLPELQRRYDRVEISLLTPKVTLVPEAFLDAAGARQALAEVASLRDTDFVETVPLPELGATLVYSNSLDESLSRVMSQTVLPTSGTPVPVFPEMYYLLRKLDSLTDYNKIVASWHGGYLHLVIAQGKSLCLANVFEAPDFTTAEYFLFLCLKKLQLNPEVSTVCFRTPLDHEAEMSLYRYFRSVVQL